LREGGSFEPPSQEPLYFEFDAEKLIPRVGNRLDVKNAKKEKEKGLGSSPKPLNFRGSGERI
jgi:hypothetical protein